MTEPMRPTVADMPERLVVLGVEVTPYSTRPSWRGHDGPLSVSVQTMGADPGERWLVTVDVGHDIQRRLIVQGSDPCLDDAIALCRERLRSALTHAQAIRTAVES